MKIVISVLTLWAVVLQLNAQEYPSAFIKYFNSCVNVYKSPEGCDVKLKIFQDTINETNYYNLYFLDKSPYRFKVKIQAYEYIEPIEGWIDKDCIAVYSRKKDGVIYLYSNCTEDSEFQIIEQSPTVLTVIDYYELWRKVMFTIDEILYIGWTKNYCPIIYNSCS